MSETMPEMMPETARLPSPDQAWQLLCESPEGRAAQARPRRRGHDALHARLWNKDEALSSLTGLLHDFDYERWPDQHNHPYRGVEILAAQGYPDAMRTAILGHAPYTGTPRQTRLARPSTPATSWPASSPPSP